MNARLFTLGPVYVAGAALALGGCANMSGLSGSADYACNAPAGVACESVSGTYANAVRNNLPTQRPRPTAQASTDAPAMLPAPVRPDMPSGRVTVDMDSASSMPLRSSARILRLWFKPWEDADRDLYEQGYVYVQIDSGQWLVEHAQRRIREAHAPLRPPPRSAPPADEAKNGDAALQTPKGAARLPSIDSPLSGWVPPALRPDGND